MHWVRKVIESAKVALHENRNHGSPQITTQSVHHLATIIPVVPTLSGSWIFSQSASWLCLLHLLAVIPIPIEELALGYEHLNSCHMQYTFTALLCRTSNSSDTSALAANLKKKIIVYHACVSVIFYVSFHQWHTFLHSQDDKVPQQSHSWNLSLFLVSCPAFLLVAFVEELAVDILCFYVFEPCYEGIVYACISIILLNSFLQNFLIDLMFLYYPFS